MNRDRGRIKWTAMMLTEHITRLREWVGEDNHEEKPDIDEWTLHEFQRQLGIAYLAQCEIRVKTWRNGTFTDITGILNRMDDQMQLIYIADGLKVQKVSLNTVVGIETTNFD